MGSVCAKFVRSGWKLSAELRAPSAVTAPRQREQRHPSSPPDRRPPRRGGRPSSKATPAGGGRTDAARLGGTGGATAGRSAQGRAAVAGRLARSTAAVLAVMATVLLAVLLVGGEALAQTETEHWSATLTRANGVGGSRSVRRRKIRSAKLISDGVWVDWRQREV